MILQNRTYLLSLAGSKGPDPKGGCPSNAYRTLESLYSLLTATKSKREAVFQI